MSEGKEFRYAIRTDHTQENEEMITTPEQNAGTSSEETLERIQYEFMEDRDAGRHPTLESYRRRYPQYALEITDFVLTYLATESAAARMPDPVRPSPTALRAFARARTQLGLAPQAAEQAQPVQALPGATFAEVRKAKGLTPGKLARALNVPNMVVVWMERGQIREWPALLEARLSQIFECTAQQVGDMLRMPATLREAPAHYSATGTPTREPRAEGAERSFDEALVDAGATDDQIRNWQDTKG